MNKPKLDEKIINFPTQLELSNSKFLAITVTKNLNIDELNEFYEEFVKQANKKMQTGGINVWD